VFTPLVSSGCIDGVYRKAVMDAAAKLGINTTENAGATKDDLTNADEIFLCNVISGIRWVSALDDRRYYAGVAKRLQQEINNICRS
jgi:branched-chain amino acid aminotransferase